MSNLKLASANFLKVDDDGRLYLTSDAPVRRREATQPREVARESDLANAHEKTRRRRAPGQIMEDGISASGGLDGPGPENQINQK